MIFCNRPELKNGRLKALVESVAVPEFNLFLSIFSKNSRTFCSATSL